MLLILPLTFRLTLGLRQRMGLLFSATHQYDYIVMDDVVDIP